MLYGGIVDKINMAADFDSHAPPGVFANQVIWFCCEWGGGGDDSCFDQAEVFQLLPGDGC